MRRNWTHGVLSSLRKSNLYATNNLRFPTIPAHRCVGRNDHIILKYQITQERDTNMNLNTYALTRRKLFYYGYGMGEFGFTFFLMFIAYHLMYFMTDVLNMPAGIAAVTYTTIQWFEGITMV